MKIVFHPLAVRDLLDAQIYYSEINPVLSRQFRQQIDLVVEPLFRFPFFYHPIAKRSRFRRANLEQFPYNLVYEVIEDQSLIRVLTVRHHKRHPSHGLNRSWPES